MLLRGSEALMLFLVEFLVHKLHGLPFILAYLFPLPSPLPSLFLPFLSFFPLPLSFFLPLLPFSFIQWGSCWESRLTLLSNNRNDWYTKCSLSSPPLSLSFLLLSYLNHVGSAVSTGMLGVAYFARIYHLYYFIIWMALSGMMQVENILF